jgi:DNA polymerase-3 subunit beta
LPKAILSEVSRLSPDGNIGFSYSKLSNQALFEIADTILSSRIIEGEFPDFEKIIPKETKIKVNLDKEDFLQAVKLASIFARDSANVVKISLNEGKISLLAESSATGSQKKEIEAKVESSIPQNEEFVVAFNYRFLEEYLGAVKGDSIQMELSDPNAPALFLDPGDNDFLHIIMPIRLQG